MRTKIVHVELCRIQNNVCHVANGVQPLSLGTNRLHDGVASPHRVRAPRLGEASNQRIFARLQKHYARWQHLANVFQDCRKLIQPHPLAHIDDQRSALDLRRLANQIRKSRHQLQWQIVDRIVAEVLKRLQRG